MKKPPRVFIHPELILQGLLLAGSPYAWLIAHCSHGHCRPVTLSSSVRRIDRVLRHPAFGLSEGDRFALYSEFLPRVEFLAPDEFLDRVDIVVDPAVLIPGLNEEDGITYISPGFYKALVGLDDDPEEEP